MKITDVETGGEMMDVSNWDLPPVTGDEGYGQGWTAHTGNIQKFCASLAPAHRAETDGESLDAYRIRHAAETKAEYTRNGGNNQSHVANVSAPDSGHTHRNEPKPVSMPQPEVEFPWWEQDATQPVSIPVEIVQRDWLGRVKK